MGSVIQAAKRDVGQKFTSVDELDGQLFAIINEDDSKAFCMIKADGYATQNMYYESYSTAFSAASYYFKIEAAEGADVDGYYYIRTYTPTGDLYNVWGSGGYLNSQSADGGCCFSLGLKNQNGQDIENGAVWDIEANGGTFALRNVGTGKYLKDAAPAKYDEPTYFTFCTVDVEFEEGDEITGLPTTWVGQTGNFSGIDGSVERYQSGPLGVGDVLTQSLKGMKSGTYEVTLELAASFTSGRGFVCPTGDDLSVAFANDDEMNLPVVERGWVSSGDVCTLTAMVTDGTIEGEGNLKYGIKNIDASGNWYVAKVQSIVFVEEGVDPEIYSEKINLLVDEAGLVEEGTIPAAAYAALQDAVAKYSKAYATGAEYEAAIVALTKAIDKANGFVAPYATYQDWMEKANILAESDADVQSLVVAADKAVEAATEVETLDATINQLALAITTPYNGVVYIKDAETDKYIAAGHNWGTRGIVVEDYGLDLTLTANEETHKVAIDTQVFYNNDRHYLGNDLYTDNYAYGWGLMSIGEDSYYIFNADGMYISVDGDDNLTFSDEPREWILISEKDMVKQRFATLAEASTSNPVDATWLLKNPNFNRGDARINAWTVSEDCVDYNLSGGKEDNHCAESFHSPFTISQTVTGAPAGFYELTAQGFYRQDEEVTEMYPMFFIGDATADVPELGDLPDHDNSGSNSMADASVEFAKGNYTIDLPIRFYLAEGEELTVGVQGTAGLQWVCFDNFRLSYLGYAIDENYDYTPAAKENVTVQLTRSIKEGLNTLVLPFDMSQAEVEKTFGEGSKVYKVDAFNSETGVMTFKKTDGLTANLPCVLEATEEGYEYTIEGRTIKALSADMPVTTVDGLSFIGSYRASYDIDANDGNYVLGGGKIWEVNSDDVQMYGTRAYFHVEGASNAKALDVIFDEDDDAATAIAGINSKKIMNGAIYNMAGQRVDANYKGFVIKGGNKVLLK